MVLKDDNEIAAGLSSIYPNPVKNILNVKIASSGNNKVILPLTDLSGRLLQNKTTQISNGETIVQLDVSHLAPGTFFLKIVCSDVCETAVKKFVKQ
ncbi:MAG: T9SS type A sorting domain-containing protein [Panacibacter sp.]